MNTQIRQSSLEMFISNRLRERIPQVGRDLSVTALSDGTVYVRGAVRSTQEAAIVRDLVREIPGVTEVFCNTALAVKEAHIA